MTHHRSGHWSNAPALSKTKSAVLAVICLLAVLAVICLLWAVALIAWVWVMP